MSDRGGKLELQGMLGLKENVCGALRQVPENES